MLQNVVSNEVKKRNIRYAIIYFSLLVSAQAIVIYLALRYNLKAQPYLLVFLVVFVATIWPILLARILFRSR